MDPRERWHDPEEGLRAALGGWQSKLWMSAPGIVVSFDASSCTAVIQPAVGGLKREQDGTTTPTTLPVITDVPVVFPRGGFGVITFPVAAGDEVLLVFSCRPIDAWWQSGGVQRPGFSRMHSLSDAFAVIGPASKPSVPASISTDSVEMRSHDGAVKVSLNPGARAVSITAPGGIMLNGPVTINGPITQGAPAGGGSAASSLIGPLTVTQDVTAGGKSLKTHTHPNGSPNTGTPN